MSAPVTLSDLSWELLLNAITGACASFAGAYGAWKIASRAERRKAVGDEITACNVAVGLCGAILNMIISLKSQLLAPKVLDYKARFEKYGQVSEAAWLGLPYEPLEMGADLRAISLPYLPLNDLQLAVSGIKGNSKAPMLLASVQQAIEGLTRSVARHNEISRSMIGKGPDAALYFGLLNDDGTGADETFPDVMRAMDMQSADAIYFPELLASLITRHADDLARLHVGQGFRVSRLLPAPSRFKPIMPNPADYSEFEAQFRPKARTELPEVRQWYMAHYEGIFQKLMRRLG